METATIVVTPFRHPHWADLSAMAMATVTKTRWAAVAVVVAAAVAAWHGKGRDRGKEVGVTARTGERDTLAEDARAPPGDAYLPPRCWTPPSQGHCEVRVSRSSLAQVRVSDQKVR